MNYDLAIRCHDQSNHVLDVIAYVGFVLVIVFAVVFLLYHVDKLRNRVEELEER